MCDRLKVDPYNLAAVINIESGFKSGAENFAAGKTKPPVAKGLNQLTYETAKGMGMSDEVWAEYHTYSAEQQLPWVEKYFRGTPGLSTLTPGQLYQKNYGGYKNPDGSLYSSKQAQIDYLNSQGIAPTDENRRKFFRNADFQEIATKQNPGLTGKDGRSTQAILDSKVGGGAPAIIKARIDAARSRNGGGPPPAPKVPAAPSSTDGNSTSGWAGQGSQNSNQSKQESSKTQTKDLNKTELGKRFQAAQQAEINATLLSLEIMRNTPPLRLLVNPKTFKVSSEKIVADGNWTRNGPIVEHWGDGQDKIDFSGKIAAFMAIDANSPREDNEGGSPGLTRAARNYSASYQNFLSMWMLYRSNAGLYTYGLDAKSASGSQWARLSMVGSIYIYYDDILYFGSFDTFDVTESETSPYSLEYNIQFTVRAMFLLNTPPNPREGSYGAAATKFFVGDPNVLTSQQQAESQVLGNLNQAALAEEARLRQAQQQAQFDAAAARFDAENGIGPSGDPSGVKLAEDLRRQNPPSGANTIDPDVQRALKKDSNVKPTPLKSRKT